MCSAALDRYDTTTVGIPAAIDLVAPRSYRFHWLIKTPEGEVRVISEPVSVQPFDGDIEIPLSGSEDETVSVHFTDPTRTYIKRGI